MINVDNSHNLSNNAHSEIYKERLEEFKALYFEVLDFLASCGDGYKKPTRRLCASLLMCLDNGQYYLERNADGQIVQFCDYWLIGPADVEAVRSLVCPANYTTGSVLFVVDYGNKSGRAGLHEMIRALRKRCTVQGVAWWHKETEFKVFGRQKGGV